METWRLAVLTVLAFSDSSGISSVQAVPADFPACQFCGGFGGSRLSVLVVEQL